MKETGLQNLKDDMVFGKPKTSHGGIKYWLEIEVAL